ncbi:MAG: glycoside hydrolase family 9 protein [Ruminococcus sp.]|nr:glycoside hydrolase family 9 protein [Ruminococcus sp.]
MKKFKLVRKLTAGFTSAVTAAVCAASSFSAPTAVITASAAPDTENYAKLLQYSLYMYDANMCGDQVDEKSGFSWRGDCHTGDLVPGGFHDCGDHVKFGITAGYSAATLGWSYMEYGDVFDELGQTGHLKLITDHFAKYFRDCTTLSGGTVTNFIYQIGDGDMDHNQYWGPPEEQDQSSRKVFQTSSGASDIAAEYAAALAVNYINFGNEEDLTYAKALWDFSTRYNQCATEGASNFYNSDSYIDDQAFAAGFLYLATEEDNYKNFLKSNMKDPNWIYCWNNVYLGASVLNGEINGDYSIVQKFASRNFNDPGTWYVPDGWGAARYNTAAQFMGLLLTEHDQGNYSAWAKSQMSMILGDNPKNVCLVVGYSDISAKYPHHEAASGLRGWGEYNAAGATFGGKGYTLTGALEGGFSNTSFQYVDALNDITSSEVGIDYNATLVAAAAGLYKIYGTGTVDSSVNGIGRDIQYENPTSTTETTTTTTTTTETTTTTTTPVAPQYLVKVNIVAEDTGEQLSGVTYSISGGGENGAYYGSKEFVSSSEPEVVNVNWHDMDSLDGTYWEVSIKDVPQGYMYPSPLNTSIPISRDSVAEVTVEIPLAPDYSTMTFELALTDKDTGKAVPGVEFSISGKESGNDLGTKTYVSGDGLNVIDMKWDNITDPSKTTWTCLITSVPEGYDMPEDPDIVFVFQTLNKVSSSRELTANGSSDLWGDANCSGEVNMADAVAIMRSQADPDDYALSAKGKRLADVAGNGDGVTNADALAIQQYEAGLVTELPVKS